MKIKEFIEEMDKAGYSVEDELNFTMEVYGTTVKFDSMNIEPKREPKNETEVELVLGEREKTYVLGSLIGDRFASLRKDLKDVLGKYNIFVK